MTGCETRSVPSYRLHKASGQAIVTIDGQMIYVGRWETPKSREKYERVIGEWLARGQYVPASCRSSLQTLSVDDLMAGFWRHAEGYYRKDGRPTGELACLRQAMRWLHRSYGSTRAAEFGGLGFVVLESISIGGTRCTSVEGLQRFFERLSGRNAECEPRPPGSSVSSLATTSRQLRAAGIVTDGE